MIIPNIWKNEIHVPNHQPVMLEAMGFYSEISGLFINIWGYSSYLSIYGINIPIWSFNIWFILPSGNLT
jgi:hypothetical protein